MNLLVKNEILFRLNDMMLERLGELNEAKYGDGSVMISLSDLFHGEKPSEGKETNRNKIKRLQDECKSIQGIISLIEGVEIDTEEDDEDEDIQE